MEKLTAEAKKQEAYFRDKHMPEEAHRIATQVRDMEEQLFTFRSMVNLEGYIRYFYEDTLTLPELFLQASKAGSAIPAVFYMDEPTHIEEHVKAIELEFRESMEQRVQKGYILPGQMDILYSGEQVAAKLMKCSVVTISTMDIRGGYFKADLKVDVSARNVAPYNNSFEALVKDLRMYRKNGYRVLLLSASGGGLEGPGVGCGLLRGCVP